jgi:beta-1,4-mannosyl-glycoprotein beta-1,4-N-acetylglucosaminyltransferase
MKNYYDIVLLGKELNSIKMRLKFLNDEVTHFFIIVPDNSTILNLDELEFEPFKSKISIISVSTGTDIDMIIEGFYKIIKSNKFGWEDSFFLSKSNEIPNLRNPNIDLNRKFTPILFRMDWFVNSFSQKSKDKWMGTFSFNFSMALEDNNLIKNLFLKRNSHVNNNFHIIDNGFFFQSIFENDELNGPYRFDGTLLKNRIFETIELKDVFPNEYSSYPTKYYESKIIDCFVFNDEIDLLEKRLRLLDSVVDKFVLVESKFTHAGTPKSLYFNENIEKFKSYEDKIIHIVIDKFPESIIYDPTESDVDEAHQIHWFRENYQRNEILRGLYQIDLSPNDFILISDLDEIPDPNKLEQFFSKIPKGEYRFQSQKWLCWDLNRKYNHTWPGTCGIRWSDLQLTTPQIVRSQRYEKNLLLSDELFGWHCSWFGGINQIMSKLSSFAHQELKDITIEDIENKMTMNLDIHGQVLLDNNDGYDPEFI